MAAVLMREEERGAECLGGVLVNPDFMYVGSRVYIFVL